MNSGFGCLLLPNLTCSFSIDVSSGEFIEPAIFTPSPHRFIDCNVMEDAGMNVVFKLPKTVRDAAAICLDALTPCTLKYVPRPLVGLKSQLLSRTTCVHVPLRLVERNKDWPGSREENAHHSFQTISSTLHLVLGCLFRHNVTSFTRPRWRIINAMSYLEYSICNSVNNSARFVRCFFSC